MKNKQILYTLPFWLLWKLLSYYFIPSIIAFVIWSVIGLTFLILSIIQIDLLITQKSAQFQKVSIFIVLTCLSIFHYPLDTAIEKVDWLILYNKRCEAVEFLKKSANGNRQFYLPYSFPILSRENNRIDVYKSNKILSIKFWIREENDEVSSPIFEYTNDPNRIQIINKSIQKEPDRNWELEANWFRTEY